MLKIQRQHFIHLHSSFAIKMQPSSINPCPDWIYLSRSQGDKIDVEHPATKQNSWHRSCIVFAILLNCPLNQQVTDPSKKQPFLVMFGSFFVWTAMELDTATDLFWNCIPGPHDPTWLNFSWFTWRFTLTGRNYEDHVRSLFRLHLFQQQLLFGHRPNSSWNIHEVKVDYKTEIKILFSRLPFM